MSSAILAAFGVGTFSAGSAVAAASIAGTAYSASQAGKANKAAQQGANASQVDIAALDEETRKIALQNAIDSANLERQLTPEVPVLRKTSNQGLLDSLGQSPGVTKAQQLLTDKLGIPLNTPLLNDAIAKAKSNLALGGKLSLDQQNAATRSGAAKAGAAGGGTNLGLGRDLAARDLGMTSYQVEQQRLQDASRVGGQEQTLATDNSTNLLNQLQALKGISDSQYAKYLSAAQYGQSIPQPVVGLDPSAVANLTSANATNASAAAASRANIYGAQGNSYLDLVGKLAGGYLAYKGGGGSSNATPTPGSGAPSGGG